jgi:hypothetical protein
MFLHNKKHNMINLHFFDLMMESLPKIPISICIPVDYSKETEKFFIAEKFSGAGKYCILNLESKEYKVLDASGILSCFFNNELDEKEPLRIDAIISSGIPHMSHKILVSCGILIYSPINNEIQDNIELFILKQLPIYEWESIMGTNTCAGMTCTACPSNCN